MAFDVWKASDYAWVAETAEEELHLLESHHPQHFDSLKHEVAALLSEARSLLVLLPSATTCPSSSKPPSSSSQPADVESTSSASASSSNRIVRKRKCVDGGREVCVQLTIPERETCECSGGGEWMDSSDVALEKAKACLHRIREVKKDIRWCIGR